MTSENELDRCQFDILFASMNSAKRQACRYCGTKVTADLGTRTINMCQHVYLMCEERFGPGLVKISRGLSELGYKIEVRAAEGPNDAETEDQEV